MNLEKSGMIPVGLYANLLNFGMSHRRETLQLRWS